MDRRFQAYSFIHVCMLSLPSISTDYDDVQADPAVQWKAFLPIKPYLNIIHKGFTYVIGTLLTF